MNKSVQRLLERPAFEHRAYNVNTGKQRGNGNTGTSAPSTMNSSSVPRHTQ